MKGLKGSEQRRHQTLKGLKSIAGGDEDNDGVSRSANHRLEVSMRSLPALPLALLLLVAACSPPPPAPGEGPDIAAEEEAIRNLDARWLSAAQTRDAAGEAAMFANDGVAYREHLDPLVGPEAYQAYVTRFRTENPKVGVTWSTNAIQIAESGDLAIQTGQYHVTGLGPEGEGEDTGRFVTVWKKVNGEWKVAHDIGSTTMPEAPAQQKQ